MDLAVSTGQRRGDFLTLKRSQLTDEGIVFRQPKTGAGALIEWSDDLCSIMDRAKQLAPNSQRNTYCVHVEERPTPLPDSPPSGNGRWQSTLRQEASGSASMTCHQCQRTGQRLRRKRPQDSVMPICRPPDGTTSEASQEQRRADNIGS